MSTCTVFFPSLLPPALRSGDILAIRRKMPVCWRSPIVELLSTQCTQTHTRVLGERGRPWSRQLGPCCRPTLSFSPRTACSTAPWPEAWQRASHGQAVSCPACVAVTCRRHGRRPQPAVLPGRADRVFGSYTGGC